MAGVTVNWLRLYFLGSVGAALFAYGVAVGLFRIFPYGLLEDLASAARDWMRYPKHFLRIEPQKFLTPARRNGSGVVEYVQGRAYDGVTFMSGFFGDRSGLKLIDMKGNTLNQWRVSFREIWPESPHMAERPSHDWDMHIHGAVLYPDGDVVFNFQYGGLVRLDRCSRVRWKLPYQTHHSIFVDTEGNLWVPGRKRRDTPLAKFPHVPAPFQEEYILKVSPQGKLLEEISILDVIYLSGYQAVLLANGAHESRAQLPLDRDFTHLNEIEVLSPELAPAFAAFAAGDLLVSLRNLNLLMVVSPADHRIKWSMTGPFLRQHDPDFLPSGRISVFDNRRTRASDEAGSSRIVELDPVTRQVVSIYGEGDGQRFYTEMMGDHQRLPNGNLLITESTAGRAFEVAPDGQVVWSYINRWNEDSTAWIERATRYPQTYASHMKQEACP